MDELHTSITNMKQQLITQQQTSDMRAQQLEERLQQKEDAAKAFEEKCSSEHARIQKLLDECASEACKRAEDIQESLQQDIGVRA